MLCKKCGVPLNDGTKLCPRCGTLQAEPPAETYTSEQYTRPSAQPGQGNAKTTKILIIVALVNIALVLILFVLLSLGKDSDDTPATRETDYFQEYTDHTLPVEEETEPSQESTEQGPALSEDNPYKKCFQEHKDYVFPKSNSTYLCYADIDRLTEEERKIAAQEIYARHGQRFSDTHLQEYFDNREWYKAGGSFSANEYEAVNLDLLSVYESVKNGTWERSGNPYINVFRNSGDYAHPYSDSQYLTAHELKDLSVTQLELMRNEIFARHGYIFGSSDLRMYFYSKPWYRPTTPSGQFNSSVFNHYELNNVDMLQLYERRSKGVNYSSDNPYRHYDARLREYIISDSSSRYLSNSDLRGLDTTELCLARNEIAARHGYAFKDEHLLEYFLNQYWYLPNNPGLNGTIQYSAIEQANIELIQKKENGMSLIPDVASLERTPYYTVSCDYFSIAVPAYFKQYATIKTSSNSIDFAENISPTLEPYCDGGLYYLKVSSDPESLFDEFGSPLGELTNSAGDKLYVICYRPTDVRYASEAGDLYSRMADEFYGMDDTIQGKNGYTYTPYE